MTKRTVITGSSGFVGSLLCRVLPIPIADRYDILDGVSGDITNSIIQSDICRDASTIIHLAAISGIKACSDHPTSSFAINVLATQQLALAAKKAGVRRFVFASSSAVYGEAQSYKMDETHPTDPRSEYGKQKLKAESILGLSSEEFEVIVLRKSNLYGWGMVWKGITVIDKFIDACLLHEPMKLVGTGSQKRDFLHVLDAVKVYTTLINAKRVRSGIYNLGGHTPLSVRQIAEMVNDISEEVTGHRSPIDFLPDDGSPLFHDFKYDSTKARMEFQYQPCMTVEFYIKERFLSAIRTGRGVTA